MRGSGVPAGWPTLSHNGGERLFSLVSARSLQYGQHQSQGITKKKQNEIFCDMGIEKDHHYFPAVYSNTLSNPYSVQDIARFLSENW